MPQYAYVHCICYTHPYNWSVPSCYSSTAAFNDCYSELMPYTALANSYWVSVYDAYQHQGHTHWLSVQLLYNSCWTCLTNHIGSILCHIMPLVNSLRGRHTHTDVCTGTILRETRCAGLRSVHAWFNNIKKLFQALNPLSYIHVNYNILYPVK